MIRITGPGLGFRPYFTYDGSNRVTQMSLESSNPAENRLTYYTYDANGFLSKMQGPENYTSYFNYDANSNLKEKINPDGGHSYFSYTSDTIPRIQEINLPKRPLSTYLQ